MDLTSAGYVSNFTTFDWCIVGAYLLLSVGMLVACAAAGNHLGWTNILSSVVIHK